METKSRLLNDQEWGWEREKLLPDTAKMKRDGISVVGTFFNFAKASIGSGSFALPWAILQCGVVIGTAGTILLGLLSVYTMQLLIECKLYLSRELSPAERRAFNFTELGKRALGESGKWAVNLSVVGCNLGVCAAYMIFISNNLRVSCGVGLYLVPLPQWAFTCFTPTCFTTWEMYGMVLPVLILLTFLPSFKWLQYAAYIGSVFLIVAMLVVYVYGAYNPFLPVACSAVIYMPPNWEGVALWFGVTAFLFCVHSMVIPLESEMAQPRKMFFVLDMACIVVIGLNMPFALYGYFLFGKQTEGYVFENLSGGTFNNVVRILLSVELILTFPIVFKPASDIVEEVCYNVATHMHPALSKSGSYDQTSRPWQAAVFGSKCLLRALLVLVSWGVAVGVPRFEICLALVGSLTATVLAFVLPPLFHIIIKWHHIGVLKKGFHILIVIFGIVATLLTTGVGLYSAITSPGSSTSCTAIKDNCIAQNSYPPVTDALCSKYDQ